jgi:hypothetical protein
MKWAVEIQKTNLERRNLADLLGGLGFALIDGIQFPAFASPEIDGCDTAADVFEKAKQLRAVFAGPAEIDLEFSLGSVIDYASNPPKRHAFLEVEPLICKTSFGSVTLTVLPLTNLRDGMRSTPNGNIKLSWKTNEQNSNQRSGTQGQRKCLNYSLSRIHPVRLFTKFTS